MRRVVVCLALGAAACDVGSRQSAVGSEPTVGSQPSAVVSEPVAEQPVPRGPFGLGRKPTAEEVKAWNTSVNAQGRNLPPGRGTVAEGKVVYTAQCAVCHGLDGEGTPPLYPKLVGKEPADFSFDSDFKITHTIGNYWPYATTLYDYINRAMPLTAPGSLKPPQIYAVVAYLLAANGVIAENAVMDARSLPKVEMPARARFVVDDRTGGSSFR